MMKSIYVKQMAHWAAVSSVFAIAIVAQAEQQGIKVDLAAAHAADQWHFSDQRATVTDGTLRLDGRSSPTYAFLKSPALGDVALSAKYRVEADAGVQAIGLVIGSTDSVNCHYLHRAPGDMIVMAHRLPSTSLHYSLDEGQTWSENVVVDKLGGAYPSMVTLKDESILIVYYEEGDQSSIRARRFRATPAGIEWLPLDPDSSL